MMPHQTRREFIKTSSALAAALALPTLPASGVGRDAFSFALLGDLHFDKLSHHDLAWLEREKPDDLRQVRDYSRITQEIMPALFNTIRESVAASGESAQPPTTMAVHVGDFVEGLCGSETLATLQNQEAVEFVRNAKLGVPFLFTKGNHDVTGPGAVEAFEKVFHPFLKGQSATWKGKLAGSCLSLEHRNALFCFFDAYKKESLDWLESVLAQRSATHCFIVVHLPVVPYGARSTWHLYPSDRQKPAREKMLQLLGRHQAIVLSGHIHKYNLLVRQTPNGGRFLQFALSSVISSKEVKPKTELSGTMAYNADQVLVEPKFSPATEMERRAVYDREKPFVTHFEYADLPGYAVLAVEGANVEARIYSGVSRQLWRTLKLTQLLHC